MTYALMVILFLFGISLGRLSVIEKCETTCWNNTPFTQEELKEMDLE